MENRQNGGKKAQEKEEQRTCATASGPGGLVCSEVFWHRRKGVERGYE
jgi:hypothetical protein